MRRLVTALALAVLLAAAAGYAWVNLAPDDPALWHADPLTAPGTGRPNEARVLPGGGDMPSPVFAMPPATLAARFDAAALAEPRTRRLAGRPEDGWTTYVQRSAVVGWPDYVSVRVVEVEGGAALAVWSRSRYGHSDLGVNRARVERWLAALPRD